MAHLADRLTDLCARESFSSGSFAEPDMQRQKQCQGDAQHLIKLHDERICQRKILEQCARLIEDEKLGVLISFALPLAEAQQAHRMIEQGGVMGKIILTMD